MTTSAYLGATNEGVGAASHDFEALNEAWMGNLDGDQASFPGIDVGSYAASPTPLLSPETPSLDNIVYPTPMGGDFTNLDPLFGDYSPAVGHFPVPLGNRVPTSMAESYGLNSPAPSPYSAAGTVWPSHVAPTAFLPTPPMAVDQYSSQDDSGSDDSPKRKALSAAAAAASSSSSSSRVTKKRAPTQLRTASRAPKKRTANTLHKPAENVEEVKARAAHNQVEQQYRKRLNTHFEKLLEVLPPLEDRGEAGDKRVSKAEVLDLARMRIRELEKNMGRLERERRELRGRISGLEKRVGGRGM